MANKSSRQQIKQHVDKKLQFRLRIYFVISLLLAGIVLYDVSVGIVSLLFALIGVVIGIGVGVVSARMFHISWNKDVNQVVSRLDMFGTVILVLYITFAIFRSSIIGHFVHGAAVGGISLSIATGIMFGRVLGTRGKILRVLQEQKIF